MPKGARWPRRGTLWLRFGAPEAFGQGAGQPSRAELRAFAELVRRRTATMLADLASESGIPLPGEEPS
jgi:hypothetical protein